MRRDPIPWSDAASPERMPTRRDVLAMAPSVGIAAVVGRGPAGAAHPRSGVSDYGSEVPERFPRQSDDAVEEIVTVAHFDVDRVRTLVEARPALARASWDWGFGDWETPIGAASHTGRRDIADVLLVHGARPTLFTAAMMGWLEVVRAAVAARPGIQRETGPHGITLLAHARAGGEAAREVVAWLQDLDDADPAPEWGTFDPAPYQGTYVFGEGEADRLVVATDRRGRLTVQRPGQAARPLVPLEMHRFHPAGVPSVRVEFSIVGVRAEAVVVRDAGLVVRALRPAAGAGEEPLR